MLANHDKFTRMLELGGCWGPADTKFINFNSRAKIIDIS